MDAVVCGSDAVSASRKQSRAARLYCSAVAMGPSTCTLRARNPHSLGRALRGWCRTTSLQAANEVGNPKRHRLLQNLAIHLPNVIADTQSDCASYTSINITRAYRPFRERISHGTIPMRMPPALWPPIIAESKLFHRIIEWLSCGSLLPLNR